MNPNNIDLTASGMPMYGGMMTPWQQMQMMYQNQSQFLAEQQKLLMQEKGLIVLKMFFVREKENRRVKIKNNTDFKKLFEYVHHYIQPYHTLKGARVNKLQYEDEDKEWMNFNSEKEWTDCKRICATLKKTNIVKIKIFTDQKTRVKDEPLKIPMPSMEPINENSSDESPVAEINNQEITRTNNQEITRTGEKIVVGGQGGMSHPYPVQVPKQEKESLTVKYSRQLEALKSMGFYNMKENLKTLEKFQGNVDAVVKEFMRV